MPINKSYSYQFETPLPYLTIKTHFDSEQNHPNARIWVEHLPTGRLYPLLLRLMFERQTRGSGKTLPAILTNSQFPPHYRPPQNKEYLDKQLEDYCFNDTTIRNAVRKTVDGIVDDKQYGIAGLSHVPFLYLYNGVLNGVHYGITPNTTAIYHLGYEETSPDKAPLYGNWVTDKLAITPPQGNEEVRYLHHAFSEYYAIPDFLQGVRKYDIRHDIVLETIMTAIMRLVEHYPEGTEIKVPFNSGYAHHSRVICMIGKDKQMEMYTPVGI